MIRNILAVIIGLVIGSFVNMALILTGHHVIPLPEGADVSTMENLKASMHLFEAKHFIFPILAHAVGTFAGALVAGLIATRRHLLICMIIGIAFLIGGTINAFTLPTSALINTIDLVLAYIPTAGLAYWLVSFKKRRSDTL